MLVKAARDYDHINVVHWRPLTMHFDWLSMNSKRSSIEISGNKKAGMTPTFVISWWS
jgi:hypothetical protein